MEFSDVVRKRRMVRDFDPRPLPAEGVSQILANAQRGPSSGFTQGFEFLVFEGPEQTARCYKSTNLRHFWFWQDKLVNHQLPLAEILLIEPTLTNEARQLYQDVYDLWQA